MSVEILIGIIITSFVGVLGWSLTTNFREIKDTLKDIKSSQVTRELCGERHRAIDEKLTDYQRNIRKLYSRTDGLAYLDQEDDNGNGI